MIYKYFLFAFTLLTECAASAQTPSLVMLLETPPRISTLSDGQVSAIASPANSWSVTPSWTTDGRIIFISDRSGTRQIWIMNSSGVSTHRQFASFDPGWNAADGSRRNNHLRRDDFDYRAEQ